MNKKISTSVGAVVIILILAALIVMGTLWLDKNSGVMPNVAPQQGQVTPPIQPSMGGGSDKQKACLDSGGTVSTVMCCGQTQDFPNSCLIGACGCSPTSSHEVKTCDCGEGKCFDGTSCVQSKILK